MGSGASLPTQTFLSASELDSYTRRFQFSVEEVEYAYIRYSDLMRPSSENSSGGSNSNVAGSNTTIAAKNGNGVPPSISELFALFRDSFLIQQIVSALFPDANVIQPPPSPGKPAAQQAVPFINLSFEGFLSGLSTWRNASVEDRARIVFKILDADRNGALTDTDLVYFVAHAANFTPQLGQRLCLQAETRMGVIRFVGPMPQGPGKWIGLELDEPTGNCDGTLNGVSYFKCHPNRGIFVQKPAVFLPFHFVVARELLKQMSPSGFLDAVDFAVAVADDHRLANLLDIDLFASLDA